MRPPGNPQTLPGPPRPSQDPPKPSRDPRAVRSDGEEEFWGGVPALSPFSIRWEPLGDPKEGRRPPRNPQNVRGSAAKTFNHVGGGSEEDKRPPQNCDLDALKGLHGLNLKDNEKGGPDLWGAINGEGAAPPNPHSETWGSPGGDLGMEMADLGPLPQVSGCPRHLGPPPIFWVPCDGFRFSSSWFRGLSGVGFFGTV